MSSTQARQMFSINVITLNSKLKQLEKENTALKLQLDKKQFQINKTNAYWKSVLRKQSSSKQLQS